MAVSYFAGGEAGATADLVATGTATVDTLNPASGQWAYRANPAGAATGYFTLNAPAATGVLTNVSYSSGWFGTRVWIVTLPAASEEPIAAVNNIFAGMMAELRITSGGILKLYDSVLTLQATGTRVLAAGQWYWLTVKVGMGNPGPYEVYLNGTLEFSGTGNMTAMNAGAFLLGKTTNRNGQSVDYYFDDVQLDTAAHPTPACIARLDVTGAGNYSQWTGTYADVDDVPHDTDSTYLTDAVSGDVSSFVNEGLATSGITGQIVAVRTSAFVRDEGNANARTQILLRSGATDDYTTSNRPGATYTLRTKVYTTDPNTGAAWTLAGLAAAEVGVKNAAAYAVRCTQLSLQVLYRPASIGATCSWSVDSTRTMGRLEIRWTADSAGAVTLHLDSRPIKPRSGRPYLLVTAPGTTTAPTTLYDVTLEDQFGNDVLQGAGANRSATAIETAWPSIAASSEVPLRPVHIGELVVKVANAGAGGTGASTIYFALTKIDWL